MGSWFWPFLLPSELVSTHKRGQLSRGWKIFFFFLFQSHLNQKTLPFYRSEEGHWGRISLLSGSFDEILWFGKDGTLLAARNSTVTVLNKWIHSSTVLYRQNSTTTALTPTGSSGGGEKKDWIWDFLSLAALENDPLPDYDPKTLREYLLWGNFDRVSQILEHLCSILGTLKDADLKELRFLPPVSLSKLLKKEQTFTLEAATGDSPEATTTTTSTTSVKKENQYTGLFETAEVSFSLDDEEEKPVQEQNSVSFLGEKLASLALPGITKKDQVMLLAIVDTLNQLEAQKRGLPSFNFFLFSFLFFSSSKTLIMQLWMKMECGTCFLCGSFRSFHARCPCHRGPRVWTTTKLFGRSTPNRKTFCWTTA